ncbi:GTP-binding protein EngA, partial [Reticulomyxa filosa]
MGLTLRKWSKNDDCKLSIWRTGLSGMPISLTTRRTFGKANKVRKSYGYSLDSAAMKRKQKSQGGMAPAWLHQVDEFSELRGPRVAIIGRTNVGKSTLFNKLCRSRLAIVDDKPGVTRDRQEGQAKLVDLEFVIVDTPGIEELSEPILRERKIDLNEKSQLLRGMIEQATKAIDYADVILFMYDAKVGITSQDVFLAKWLKKKIDYYNSQIDHSSSRHIQLKTIIPIANKSGTGRYGLPIISQGYELGLGEVVVCAAVTEDGFVDLFHALDDAFKQLDLCRSTNVKDTFSSINIAIDTDPWEIMKQKLTNEQSLNANADPKHWKYLSLRDLQQKLPQQSHEQKKEVKEYQRHRSKRKLAGMKTMK